MTKWLVNNWYQAYPVWWSLILLLPFSALYRLIMGLRRCLYRLNILKYHRLTVPVIIVGNISVGGTGKTPAVIWLAKQLQHAGYHPGIISRGYGGQAEQYPISVTPHSDPAHVGDEPLIISRQSHCPIIVSPNRVQAGEFLLQHHDCDVIISDDGLQHYALERDIELLIVDGKRQFGNGYCLPTGPLREPLSRLQSVDFIVHTMSQNDIDYTMNLIQTQAINIVDNSLVQALEYFHHKTVHAVAGIGHPERFFEQLQQQGITVIAHPFADHHPFQISDLDFNDDLPILMTEKDAVKCQHFDNNKLWFIPIEATINGKLARNLLTQLAGLYSNG